LFVRHLAWLHATPEHKDQSKPRKARIDEYTKGHGYNNFPKCEADYLLDHLMRAGICSSGINGAASLTWSELDSYVRRSGADLDDWDCEAMIELSRAYISTLSAAKDPHYPPPHVTQDPDELELHEQWVIDKDNERDRIALATENALKA
jgi:hypothetical protein